MVRQREEAQVSHKLDRTVVTDIDKHINRMFIKAVRDKTRGRASIIGEEESFIVEGSSELWVVDPLDGTGEYVRSTKEDGSPLLDTERTTCFGAAVLRASQPQIAVANNPYKLEMLFGDRTTGEIWLHRRPLDLSQTDLCTARFESGLPYDYAHWDDAPVDLRFLEDRMGHSPSGSYSAIWQACMVAKGESAFAVFPGDTIHDIAPGALLVEMAGGVVSDLHGEPLDWQNLRGAVYAANPYVHEGAMQMLDNA